MVEVNIPIGTDETTTKMEIEDEEVHLLYVVQIETTMETKAVIPRVGITVLTEEGLHHEIMTTVVTVGQTLGIGAEMVPLTEVVMRLDKTVATFHPIDVVIILAVLLLETEIPIGRELNLLVGIMVVKTETYVSGEMRRSTTIKTKHHVGA